MEIKATTQIRPLTDLRASMNEITSFVDNERQPVFLTKHGHGKYVFLSMEQYSAIVARNELYEHLQEGLDDVAAGRTMPFAEAMAALRKDMENGTL